MGEEPEHIKDAEVVSDPATDDESKALPAPDLPPSVLVTKREDADGTLNFEVTRLGGLSVTEVQFVLERGIKAFRANYDLD